MAVPRTINVTRYVTPLREGGSLPAIVEADDDGLYVLKFRGAGQGARALVAELVSGELARALGLQVPEIVFANLDPDLARTEPDPEIHALIHDSAGLNLALDFLPGSVTFDPVVQRPPADLASGIVWFDAYDYAVVRIVPRVERGERMNVGVILSCPDLDFLDARIELDEARLRALDPAVDLETMRANLATIPAVCRGGPDAGPIGELPRRGRFRWLVSPRSTMIQISPVHTGRTGDPAGSLDRLLDKMVRRPA